jgi:hypothetical protein
MMKKSTSMLVLALGISGCTSQRDSGSVTAPTPPPPPPPTSAQEHSDRLDGWFFNTGRYGGDGQCGGPGNSSAVKWIWSAPTTDVIIDSKATAAQQASITTPISQYNELMGGRLTFNVHVQPLDANEICKPGEPCPDSRRTPAGQLRVYVPEDSQVWCGSGNVDGCTATVTRATTRTGQTEAGYIFLSPRGRITGAHELGHLLLGACHVHGLLEFQSAFGAADASRFSDVDMETLTYAASKGALKANARREDYIAAGAIIGTTSSSPAMVPFMAPAVSQF